MAPERTSEPPRSRRPTGLLAGTLRRLRRDIGVDHLGEIAGLGDLTELDHLRLHPGELVRGQRQVGRDRADLHGVIEDEGGAGVVGPGLGRPRPRPRGPGPRPPRPPPPPPSPPPPTPP